MENLYFLSFSLYRGHFSLGQTKPLVKQSPFAGVNAEVDAGVKQDAGVNAGVDAARIAFWIIEGSSRVYRGLIKGSTTVASSAASTLSMGLRKEKGAFEKGVGPYIIEVSKKYCLHEIDFFMSLFGRHAYENTLRIKIVWIPSSKVWIYYKKHQFIKDFLS